MILLVLFLIDRLWETLVCRPVSPPPPPPTVRNAVAQSHTPCLGTAQSMPRRGCGRGGRRGGMGRKKRRGGGGSSELLLWELELCLLGHSLCVELRSSLHHMLWRLLHELWGVWPLQRLLHLLLRWVCGWSRQRVLWRPELHMPL
jgi:hypothetical protein